MMKFIIVIFSFVLLLASHTIALAAEHNVTLDVATMVCGPDPHNIKNTLAALAGVKDVKISLETKTAIVTFDDQKSSIDQMLSAMASAGYASLVKSQN
jgi:periplasmic mercuric ion binding protein